jgi:protein-S-isoprenylcysteine O-methyltransferase Ste14
MIRAAIFIAASAVFAFLTWRSLRIPRTHGFYRFFAFELLTALVLLNAPDWFRAPLSTRQMASWIMLAASAGLAVEGFRLLLEIGRPSQDAVPSANLWFENTTALVTAGIYRFIRHPMYASLMWLGWGAFLKHPSRTGLALTIGACAFLVATAIVEERENLARFGAAYAAYMKSTKRFVPFLF